MKVVYLAIHKAQPVANCSVPDTLIEIGGKAGEFPGSPDRQAQQNTHRSQGVELEQALYRGLPGGTYDQLLVALLNRSASRLIVSHASLEESDE